MRGHRRQRSRSWRWDCCLLRLPFEAVVMAVVVVAETAVGAVTEEESCCLLAVRVVEGWLYSVMVRGVRASDCVVNV
jgi:hypothetical protein